jgi:predicted nucleic acid-binding protein
MTHNRVLFDTSCLIAGMVQKHVHHERAAPWLTRAARGEITGLVCTHSLAETYAILTSMPLRPRIQPQAALAGIHQNLSAFEFIPLTQQDYQDTLEELVRLGLVGGVVYDALAAKAALIAGADTLLTLNSKDFLRLGPTVSALILEP